MDTDKIIKAREKYATLRRAAVAYAASPLGQLAGCTGRCGSCTISTCALGAELTELDDFLDYCHLTDKAEYYLDWCRRTDKAEYDAEDDDECAAAYEEYDD